MTQGTKIRKSDGIMFIFFLMGIKENWFTQKSRPKLINSDSTCQLTENKVAKKKNDKHISN